MKTFIAVLTVISILSSSMTRVLPYPSYVNVYLSGYEGIARSNVDFDAFTAYSSTSFAGSGAVLVSSTCTYALFDDMAMIYYDYEESGNGGDNKTAYVLFDYYDTTFAPLRIVSYHSIQGYGQTWTTHTAAGL